jgi:hypothetical protein
MPGNLHEGEDIKDATFHLEEHSFRNCRLTNCFLIYDGGEFILESTSLYNCNWKFRHAARNMFQLLKEIGALGREGMPPGSVSEIVN